MTESYWAFKMDIIKNKGFRVNFIKIYLQSPTSSIHADSLVRLIRMVFEMGGKRPYSCSFVGCCLQGLFNIARSILVLFPSCLFLYVLSASMQCIHTIVLTQQLLGRYLVLFYRIDRTSICLIAYNLSIAVHTFYLRLVRVSLLKIKDIRIIIRIQATFYLFLTFTHYDIQSFVKYFSLVLFIC